MDSTQFGFATIKNRITTTKELLTILKKSQEKGWNDIITGDQSWFGFYYENDGKWCLPEETNPIMNGSKIQMQKVMVTVKCQEKTLLHVEKPYCILKKMDVYKNDNDIKRNDVIQQC